MLLTLFLTLLTLSLVKTRPQEVRVDEFEDIDPNSAMVRTMAMTVNSLGEMDQQLKNNIHQFLQVSLWADTDITIKDRVWEGNLLKQFTTLDYSGKGNTVVCGLTGAYPSISHKSTVEISAFTPVTSWHPYAKVVRAAAELCGISNAFREANMYHPSFYQLNVRNYITISRKRRSVCFGNWISICHNDKPKDFSSDIKKLHHLLVTDEYNENHYIEKNGANILKLANLTDAKLDDITSYTSLSRAFDLIWDEAQKLIPMIKRVSDRAIFQKLVMSGSKLQIDDMHDTLKHDVYASTGPYHSRPAIYRSHLNSSHIMLLASWVESNKSAKHFVMTPYKPGIMAGQICYTPTRNYIKSDSGFLVSQKSLHRDSMYNDPLYDPPVFKRINSDNLISQQGYHSIKCSADDVFTTDPYAVPTEEGCLIYYSNGTINTNCTDSRIIAVKGSQFIFYTGYNKYMVLQLPDHSLFVNEEYSHIKVNFITRTMDGMKTTFDKDQKALESWNLIGLHPHHAQILWVGVNTGLIVFLHVLVIVNFALLIVLRRKIRYLSYKDKNIIKSELADKEGPMKKIKSIFVNGMRTISTKSGKDVSFKLLGNEYEMALDKTTSKSMEEGKNMFNLQDGRLVEVDGFYLTLEGELVPYMVTKPSQTGKTHYIKANNKEYSIANEHLPMLSDSSITWKIMKTRLVPNML